MPDLSGVGAVRLHCVRAEQARRAAREQNNATVVKASNKNKNNKNNSNNKSKEDEEMDADVDTAEVVYRAADELQHLLRTMWFR